MNFVTTPRKYMKTDALEVLLYLFEHVLDGQITLPSEPKNLIAELEAAGFDKQQIENAFDWLVSIIKKQHLKADEDIKIQGTRVFNLLEEERLPLECRGLLLSLEQAGILNAAMREEIINRSLMLDFHESQIDHFHWLIMSVFHQYQSNNSSAMLLLQDFNKQSKRELH
jgi:Smg protein